MGSLAFPAPQTHADYLRLPTLRLEPDRFSPTLHFEQAIPSEAILL